MMSQPKLPAMLYEAYPYVITEPSQLNFARYGSAVRNKMPMYYWDTDGIWWVGKFTTILKRTSWMKRLLKYSDIVVVDMTFEKLESPPISEKRLLRYLSDATSALEFEAPSGNPKAYVKKIRAELRACKGASDVIQWLIRHNISMRQWERF